MANVITNILIFHGYLHRIHDLKAAIQDEELGYGSIDFNKIIPTPDDIFQGAVSLEEVQNPNSRNWFHWNPANWGCRDNAYGFEWLQPRATPATLLFATGWSPPHKVIQKLSEMFPDLNITHKWADDNFGFNCGWREYRAGQFREELFPDESRAAYEFGAKVVGIDLAKDKQLYLTEDGTTYEFRETEQAQGMEGMNL